MRAVVQRVSHASVEVEDIPLSSIDRGLLILLGVEEGDQKEDAAWLATKITNMRIFDDDDGRMNLSLKDISGQALVVSQFTLHASTKKGNRPSFIRAAKPDTSEPLYEHFCELLGNELQSEIARGQFGAMMNVSLLNHGPVTIIIDSKLRE